MDRRTPPRLSHYICTACGMQFNESADPPPRCPICEDERQFVPAAGQGWTTLAQLRSGHRNGFERLEPGLLGIGTFPDFAIGQRALLVQTGAGNYLWDCVSLIDQATVDILTALGGVRAIGVSHPHYYTTMVEWSRAFGRIPIYLHAADREWVMRSDPAIHFWEGPSLSLGPGLTIVHCGGHFPGGTVLHWSRGAEGRGVLLTSDVLQVVYDRRHVSFMHSFPNLIPVSKAAVERAVAAIAPYNYDRIYGAWWDRHIPSDARAIVARSAARYSQALSEKAG